MRETVAVLLAFGMMLLLMPQLIPLLRKMKMGQTIYELGPEQHKKKQGIPNMGGWPLLWPQWCPLPRLRCGRAQRNTCCRCC